MNVGTAFGAETLVRRLHDGNGFQSLVGRNDQSLRNFEDLKCCFSTQVHGIRKGLTLLFKRTSVLQIQQFASACCDFNRSVGCFVVPVRCLERRGDLFG